MNYTIVIPAIIAFCISALLGPVVIPFLRKLKVGQTVRDEGPKTHLQKNGTPTMGGIIILISITVTSMFYVKSNPQIVPILFLTLGFGLIGLTDDYIKVVLKRSMGAGYSGAQNPLFFNENTDMLLGDAKASIEKLAAGISN